MVANRRDMDKYFNSAKTACIRLLGGQDLSACQQRLPFTLLCIVSKICTEHDIVIAFCGNHLHTTSGKCHPRCLEVMHVQGLAVSHVWCAAISHHCASIGTGNTTGTCTATTAGTGAGTIPGTFAATTPRIGMHKAKPAKKDKKCALRVPNTGMIGRQ